MFRNPHGLATQVFGAILLGLLVGTIYYQVDQSYSSGIQNRVGAFFFVVMNYVFGNMSAVDIFIKERTIFIHENISGFYRMSVYFLAKILCDVLPQRALPVIVFTSITYWMIGLQADVWKFLFYMLNTLVTAVAGTAVALVFSASASTHTVGTLLTAMVWVFMMIFSGLLVNLQSLPHWLHWIKYTSIFRYSMNAFTVNELEGMSFCDVAGNSTTICDTGNAYMMRQGIPYESTFDLWLNEVAMTVITLFFLVLTYIQLRRIKKFN